MTLADYLTQLKARAEKARDIRSDDFGHSVALLQEWCEGELFDMSTETLKLIAMLEACLEQRNHYIGLMNDHLGLGEFESENKKDEDEDNAKLLKIAGGGE